MARYRKLPKSGKHYFRRGGKLICVLPGETVEAKDYELGGAISTYECLDPPPPPPGPTRPLSLRHAGAGRYNVINEATGNPINDDLLSKEEAQALVDNDRLLQDQYEGIGQGAEGHNASRGDGQAAGNGDTDNEE